MGSAASGMCQEKNVAVANAIEPNCINELLSITDLTGSDNTIATAHGLLPYPSTSPVKWLMDLVNLKPGDFRQLFYLYSLCILTHASKPHVDLQMKQPAWIFHCVSMLHLYSTTKLPDLAISK